MNWQFYVKHATDPVRNPIGGEFFSTEAVKNITDAVVREAVQNSLDARQKTEAGFKKPARIRIYISESQGALMPEKARRWFESLWPHILARGNGLREQPKLSEPCEFFVVEDFETTGLTGDPQAHEVERNVQNNFLNFFRAEGHSDKSGEKGGSWGIGKNAFPRASRINSYFGYTAREDGKMLLLGRSIIKFHQVEGTSYKSDGYWGVQGDNGLMLPVSDKPLLAEFQKDFNLIRTRESGLSIVVPWYDTDEAGAITFESAAEAIVRGFFFPILKGILEVEVSAPGRNITFTSSNLLEKTEAHAGAIAGLRALIPVIKMACWMETVGDDEYVILPQQPREKSQKWSEVEISPSILESLRDRIASEERVAIKTPIAVRKLKEPPVDTCFKVYLEKSQSSHKPVFIRDELVIPDVRSPSVPGVRSLVVINDSPLATLLRLAETPAHTQWNAGTGNFKNQYTFGPAVISFVSTCVSSLMALIHRSEQKPDPSLTIEYFSLPAPQEAKKQLQTSEPESKPGDGPASGASEIPSKPKRFRVTSREGGFSILPGNAEWKTDFVIEVRLAYDVRRGNPLKRYSIADFDLAKMADKIQLEGTEVVEAKGNTLLIRIVEPVFKVSVEGFDRVRDLYIAAKVTS